MRNKEAPVFNTSLESQQIDAVVLRDQIPLRAAFGI